MAAGDRTCDDGTVRLVPQRVLPAWIDRNGHMNEARYLAVVSAATDGFLDGIGAGASHVAAGHGFFTVETHLRHLGQAFAGDLLCPALRVLWRDARRLHVFVTLSRGDGVIATAEQMLIHVDIAAGRACAMPDALGERLDHLIAQQAALPRPDGAGRAVGQPR